MKIVKINCEVMLGYDKLDKNINTHILEEIKNKYEKIYIKSKKYYILEVLSIISTSNTILNSNSFPEFRSICKAKILPMDIGDWMPGTCQIARGAGIFVIGPENIAKVFIKHENVIHDGIEYSKEKNVYIKDGEIIYQDGSNVNVKIFNMEFVKTFRYIGDKIKQV